MSKISFTISSDVSTRDGIGVELYLHDKIQLEVFRDDSTRRRYIKLFSDDVDLELVELCIQKFKDENLWKFMEC
ncbi:MAG: hypothetical protein KTR35_14930 [Gammaproteobacteria bacterium]|nr:hypothetical protein [Gammaproteobacteria bacterium]